MKTFCHSLSYRMRYSDEIIASKSKEETTLQTILHKLSVGTISIFSMLYYRLFTPPRASHFLDHRRAVKKLTYIASSYVLARDSKKDSCDFLFRYAKYWLLGHETCLIFSFHDAKYWLLDTGVVCYEWILETTNPSMSGFFRPQQSPATGTRTLYMTSCFIQARRYFSRAKQDLPRISGIRRASRNSEKI